MKKSKVLRLFINKDKNEAVLKVLKTQLILTTYAKIRETQTAIILKGGFRVHITLPLT